MNNPTPPEDRGVGTYSNEYPGIFALHISELALIYFVFVMLFVIWRIFYLAFVWQLRLISIAV